MTGLTFPQRLWVDFALLPSLGSGVVVLLVARLEGANWLVALVFMVVWSLVSLSVVSAIAWN